MVYSADVHKDHVSGGATLDQQVDRFADLWADVQSYVRGVAFAVSAATGARRSTQLTAALVKLGWITELSWRNGNPGAFWCFYARRMACGDIPPGQHLVFWVTAPTISAADMVLSCFGAAPESNTRSRPLYDPFLLTTGGMSAINDTGMLAERTIPRPAWQSVDELCTLRDWVIRRNDLSIDHLRTIDLVLWSMTAEPPYHNELAWVPQALWG